MIRPQIGACGVWNVVGGQVQGRVVEHRGGNLFVVETSEGRKEYEFDPNARPPHPNDFQRRSHSEH